MKKEINKIQSNQVYVSKVINNLMKSSRAQSNRDPANTRVVPTSHTLMERRTDLRSGSSLDFGVLSATVLSSNNIIRPHSECQSLETGRVSMNKRHLGGVREVGVVRFNCAKLIIRREQRNAIRIIASERGKY